MASYTTSRDTIVLLRRRGWSGLDDEEVQTFRGRLDGMQTAAPLQIMQVSGDPSDTSITWARLEIVIEFQYTAWSGAGRVRHPAYLGTREDQAAPDAERVRLQRH